MTLLVAPILAAKIQVPDRGLLHGMGYDSGNYSM
jgi:hypothetical protein